MDDLEDAPDQAKCNEVGKIAAGPQVRGFFEFHHSNHSV
jgi:hypothetical protein